LNVWRRWRAKESRRRNKLHGKLPVTTVETLRHPKQWQLDYQLEDTGSLGLYQEYSEMGTNYRVKRILQKHPHNILIVGHRGLGTYQISCRPSAVSIVISTIVFEDFTLFTYLTDRGCGKCIIIMGIIHSKRRDN